MMQPLLTVAMVAERLRVSRTTVYQLVESGRLSVHRIGGGRGAIRVNEGDLAAYLDSCREVPPSFPTPARPKRVPPLRHLKL